MSPTNRIPPETIPANFRRYYLPAYLFVAYALLFTACTRSEAVHEPTPKKSDQTKSIAPPRFPIRSDDDDLKRKLRGIGFTLEKDEKNQNCIRVAEATIALMEERDYFHGSTYWAADLNPEDCYPFPYLETRSAILRLDIEKPIPILTISKLDDAWRNAVRTKTVVSEMIGDKIAAIDQHPCLTVHQTIGLNSRRFPIRTQKCVDALNGRTPKHLEHYFGVSFVSSPYWNRARIVDSDEKERDYESEPIKCVSLGGVGFDLMKFDLVRGRVRNGRFLAKRHVGFSACSGRTIRFNFPRVKSGPLFRRTLSIAFIDEPDNRRELYFSPEKKKATDSSP